MWNTRLQTHHLIRNKTKKSVGLETPLKIRLFRGSHCGGFCSRLWLTALTPCQIKVWKHCIQDYFPEIFFKHLETHLSLREWRRKVKDTKCVSDLSMCGLVFFLQLMSLPLFFISVNSACHNMIAVCIMCQSTH